MPRKPKGARLYKRPDDGIYLIRDTGNPDVRTGTRDFCKALKALEAYRLGGLTQCSSPSNVDVVKALNGARWRAREKNLPFDLDKDFLVNLLISQKFKCVVTGARFTSAETKFRRNPYGLSIDRIEPCEGYVKGNVRFLTVFANLAISDFGEDVFFEFARISAKFRRRNL